MFLFFFSFFLFFFVFFCSQLGYSGHDSPNLSNTFVFDLYIYVSVIWIYVMSCVRPAS